jgi:flavin reductase (DIM6/NTAB) family NADH-FMN oxidoreductase RutF
MVMEDRFKIIEPEQIRENIFKLIRDDWMLICAGKIKNYNMMTASWGTCGILWNKPVAVIFIRPQRYTHEFTENNDHFTLNFFDEAFRKHLNLLGTKSGREINKMDQAGLDAVESDIGNVYFKQSKMVLECMKIYNDHLKPEFFLSNDIEKMYPQKDYHRFYIGEIIKCMIRP